jgi:hypothetical protein
MLFFPSKPGHCPRTAYLQKGFLPTSGFWSCGLSSGWYLGSADIGPPALTPKWRIRFGARNIGDKLKVGSSKMVICETDDEVISLMI